MDKIDRLLSNVPIARRLQALVLLPLLGLLAFPVMAAVRDYNTYTQAARIGEIAALAPEINSFVHDLQSERGITAGFIASNGSTSFRERLQEQWPITDGTRERLEQALAFFDASSFGIGLAETAALIQTRIAALESVRQRALDRDLNESENLRFYTELVEALIELVNHIGQLNEQSELFGIIGAYLALVEIQEQAGLERAIGTIGFSYGYFTPPIHEEYLEHIGAAKHFGKIFDLHAPADLRAILAEVRTSRGFNEVRRLRDAAIENGYGVPVADISAAHWFDAATQMVDQLIEVKAAAALGLRRSVTQVQASARNSFIYTTGLTVLILTVVLSVVALVVRSIIAPLANLESAMGELADGNNAVAVAGTERRDEVGAMARMVEVFKERSIAREAQRELLRAKQIRLAQLERQLEKVSRANTAGEVSTALAHELNQPLASVVNYLDACRQYLMSSTPEAKHELVALFERATQQAARAADIVKDVLSMVRKDGAGLGQHDINQLVREIAHLMLSDANGQIVAQNLDLAPDLPLVTIDKIQVQQVVRNLVQNAIEATNDSDNPQLSITTQIDSNSRVLLRVTDNGKGLAEIVRENLFEPFVTTKADGLGLGLTISRSIAENHGGKLTVVSNGNGTTFELILPRIENAH